MSDIFELGAKIIEQQPYSRHLGIELVEFSREKTVVNLPLKHYVKQHHGFAHGGALSSLADVALTFAGGTALGSSVLTSEFKINFLKPAIGEKLVAEARVVSSGKRQAVCVCEIFSVSEKNKKLVAIAQGTIIKTDIG